MTLLTTIQAAAMRIGVASPTSVVGNSDTNAVALLAHAQAEGKALSRRYPWQALCTEKTFTATATETQTGAVPTDFDRFVNGTFWNRTRKRPVQGPLGRAEWNAQKAWSASALTDAFRQRGNALIFIPTPTAGDSYAYEYVSKNWCQSSGGTGQAAWAADTDTGLLDEELMTLGVIWRFKQARGLDYGEDFNIYEREVMQAIEKDGGKSVRSYTNATHPTMAPRALVPEGSWNL